MNSKHIAAVVLPLVSVSACGTKYATPRPPVSQPVEDVRVIEPVAEPVVIQRPRIEPEVDIATTATIEREPAAQSLPAAIALRLSLIHI